jgi:hypothetical protein
MTRRKHKTEYFGVGELTIFNWNNEFIRNSILINAFFVEEKKLVFPDFVFELIINFHLKSEHKN